MPHYILKENYGQTGYAEPKLLEEIILGILVYTGSLLHAQWVSWLIFSLDN